MYVWEQWISFYLSAQTSYQVETWQGECLTIGLSFPILYIRKKLNKTFYDNLNKRELIRRVPIGVNSESLTGTANHDWKNKEI